jgi:hypothetical protein
MTAAPHHAPAVLAHINYWWAGLLLLRSRVQTLRIVWLGHWRRLRCQNGLEANRERSAGAI